MTFYQIQQQVIDIIRTKLLDMRIIFKCVESDHLSWLMSIFRLEFTDRLLFTSINIHNTLFKNLFHRSHPGQIFLCRKMWVEKWANQTCDRLFNKNSDAVIHGAASTGVLLHILFTLHINTRLLEYWYWLSKMEVFVLLLYISSLN